jgi:hypothetical protein
LARARLAMSVSRPSGRTTRHMPGYNHLLHLLHDRAPRRCALQRVLSALRHRRLPRATNVNYVPF